MEKDRDNEYTCHVPIFHHVVLMAAEMDERIIIAHRHRKHEMGRYRENASCDADRHHIFLIDEVEDVFQSRKSHTHTDGIYHTVEIFIEMAVAPQHKPEHKQLCRLLWNGSVDEGVGNSSSHAELKLEIELKENEHRDDGRKHTGSDRLENLRPRLMLVSVDEVDEQNQNDDWK